MPSIAELVAQTIAPSTGCAAIQGEARAFLDAVRAKKAEGAKIVNSRVRLTLRSEWDAHIGEEALRDHLNGVCDCEVSDG